MKPFYFYLLLSLFTHLIIALILVFTNLHWSIFPKKIAFQASVRVDMVGLPDVEKKKVKKTTKKTAISLKKKQKPSKKKQTQKSQKKTEEKNLKKGNKLSKGVEGGLSQKEQMEAINIYLTLIIGKIKLNWNLPKYLSDGDYFTQLEVKINDKGQVIYKSIVTSSNNDIFDSRVLKAIESSAPFPPPPQTVKKLISDGIVFGLSSRD